MQSWFLAFVAITGVLSVFPYRERALLPAPSGNEQGFLAQEITRRGTTELVNDTIAGAGDQAARGPLGQAAGAGARRLIPALARVDGLPANGGPGISGGTGGATSTLLIPEGADGGAGAVNLADGGGAPGGVGGGTSPGPGAPGASPVNAPQGPAVLAGAAGELLAAVVPEPSTWAMFIAGLMVVGQGLRRARRPLVRIAARS